MRRILIQAALLAGGSLCFGAPVTFNRDVAPILFAHCAPCHRPGEAGPFNLLSYGDAKRHARQMVDATHSRFMPPWLPDAGEGFEDERRLSPVQIQTIAEWVKGGELEGRADDLPRRPQFTDGWQLGPPDLVLTLDRPFTLPAGGSDVYRNFIFDYPLAERRFVRALEIRPGNRRIVHHANLLVDRRRVARDRDGADGQPGFAGMDLQIAAGASDPESHFLFWKPGSATTEEPAGMSWALEPGTDLVLNTHLQPSGKPEMVQPSLGIYFTAHAPVLHPLLIQLEHDTALDIPAGDNHFTVTDELVLPEDVDLLAVYPHAHYLGRDVEGGATLPDGTYRTLIRIRHWDLNWQAVYRYQKPIFLPKGTRVSMRWIFDNSTENPLNPAHPPQRVMAGDRATDEMGHLWLQVLPRGDGDHRLPLQETVFRHKLARDPADATAHFNLGGILQAEGNPADAIAELQTAVRLKPDDPVFLNSLGALFEMAQKAGDAEEAYRQALRFDPRYADAHYNLAKLLLARQSPSDAVPELKAILRQTPQDAAAAALLSEALNGMGRQLAARGDLDGAVSAFSELVKLTPANDGALTNLGVALARQGKLTEAKDCFLRALAIAPTNAIAQANLDRVDGLLKRSTEPRY